MGGERSKPPLSPREIEEAEEAAAAFIAMHDAAVDEES